MVKQLSRIKDYWYHFIVRPLQKLRYRSSLKKAIKHANHIKYTTGFKCLVLLNPGGYKAYTKQAIKILHRQKYFKKGVRLEQIERMAIYSTN